ncbi:hypothetical protein S7335_1290 [Synechococcus sp. PCC 7335]|nr:hypothetical protein S7335_1290 [Synechococcus sp. PCC 7335]
MSWANVAKALTRQEIPSNRALSSVSEITVPRGHSVVLQFQNDRYIQSLWIDDPRIVGIATDRPLCSQNNGSQCGFATSARLTQLNGSLDLPGANFVDGNGLSTLVSVSTTNRSGTNPQIYQFQLNLVTAQAASTSLVSVVPTSQSDANNTDSLLRLIRPDYDLEKVKAGKELALERGLADVDSSAWTALENFLILTDDGIAIEEAIAATGVPVELLAELERMVEHAPTPVASFT